MKLSVIIPAYNEGRTIARVIEQVKEAPLPAGLEMEIIVVNDGSTDQTAAVVEQYSSVQLFNQDNLGKTAAVLKGIEASTGDIIIIQDADLEYHPDQYAKLVEPIMAGEHQVVYGSRFMGTIENMRPRIRLVNFLTNWTLNVIFKTHLTDNNTCYKVFKKDVLDDIAIISTHFGFDTEVTVKLLQKGVHIHEIPIHYVGRTRREGKKIGFVTGFGSYLQIFRFAMKKN
jgi:glycosyltransferase involved in cell wall biosynthesis